MRGLQHRCAAKLERIAATQAYLNAAKNSSADAIAQAKNNVRLAQEALNARRVQVLETALEMWKQAQGEVGWRREKVLVPDWVLPVEEVMLLGEIEMRERPTPGPMRIVTEVPTAADVLPAYDAEPL